MKKLAAKGLYISLLIVFLAGIAPVAYGQLFSRVNFTTNGLFTALAKDNSNNLYVTLVTPGNPAAYQVVKYPSGSSTGAVIYSGLTHKVDEFPWGLAVTSTGDVYVSTDFTANSGAIIKLAYNSGSNTYTASTFQTGRYFTALAFDSANNLYDTEYDVAHTTYAVVKYAANSAANSAGTVLYDNLKSAAGYTYPTGLAIAANGDVYVADAFSNTPSIADGGHVYKLSKASSYTATTVSTGQYSTALALDASGNLFSAENTGNGYQIVKYTAGGGVGVSVFGPMHTNGIYYPWGIVIINTDHMFAIDGDNHVLGGAVMQLTSSNAALSTLAISTGTMVPAFSPTTYNYTVSEANTLASVTMTPITQDAGATITVNGNAVTSHTASPAIPLSIGANTITTIVTAADGITKNTYTTIVTRLPSTNALLSTITTTPAGTLVGVSGPGYLNFTQSVPNSETSIQVTPTAKDPTATITVNGVAVASGSLSQAIPLSVGPNTITTVLTAQDGVTTKTVIITVTRAPSSNASLTHLTPSSGVISPVFATGTYSYTESVANSVQSITLTPVLSDLTATIAINGVVANSGVASAALPLNVGPNTINTVVTAQDGVTKKTYTLTVTRAPSSNALLQSISTTPVLTLVGATGPGYLNFTATAGGSVSSIQVIPTAKDPTATITVNGVAVNSGTASQPIALNVGQNVITTVLTAQDGVTTKTVIITVNKIASTNASLASLSLSNGTLVPAFAPATLNYTASVNDIGSLTITPTTADATATMTINGAPAASGVAAPITLVAGPNIITTVVTAQDGITTKTYKTTVTLTPGTNAQIATIATSPTLNLLSTTGTGYLNFKASVPLSFSSLQEIVTLKDPLATMTVNGTPATSGVASQVIPLAEGATTMITTVITAQDGVTTKTVTLAITRAPSSDAGLSNLALSSGTLSPAFATATTSYTASVNDIASVTVTPTANDPNAMIKVNGGTVASGIGIPVPLSPGANTITTVITANDGVTTKTYTTVVTLIPGTNAQIATIATLPKLNLLSGSGTGYLNFTASVPNTTTSIQEVITTKDPAATLMINGISAVSGSPSSPISLAVGPNLITTIITANDGVTTKTVTLTITRAAPPVADAFYENGISITQPINEPIVVDDGVVVHQAVSPNGDGVNDVLTIENIDKYPDNHLTIVDRNGLLVYEAKGYDNAARAFDGHASTNGKLQQAGTYFYSLTYTTNGQTRTRTGFIILRY